MASMALLFRRSTEDPARADASRRVAALVREIVGLRDDDAVTVSEIACGDPACGGAETVVLLMRAGRKTEAVKLMMPMAQVTDEDVRQQFSGR
jgi:hypothetical protein